MNKIDWQRKLSSRKFWALVTAVVISGMVMMGADPGSVEKVAGFIGAIASVAIYTIGESYVDASR